MDLNHRAFYGSGLQPDAINHSATLALVPGQGFEPRSVGSEPTVLPLDEPGIAPRYFCLGARAARFMIGSRKPLLTLEREARVELASYGLEDRRVTVTTTLALVAGVGVEPTEACL